MAGTLMFAFVDTGRLLFNVDYVHAFIQRLVNTASVKMTRRVSKIDEGVMNSLRLSYIRQCSIVSHVHFNRAVAVKSVDL